MIKTKQAIIIVCEGPSEEAYIQELNRIFREKECHFLLIPRTSEGGDYKTVVNKYKSVRKNNPRDQIYIWVDFDLYKRNDKGNYDKYKNKPSHIPEFLFSKMNFE